MKKPSLLTYMKGEGRGFFLELSTCRGEQGDGLSPRFPFEIIGDAPGLTRILGARVVSDGGGCIGRVFLLMSQDEYLLQEAGVQSLTNLDVEAAWENAFQAHRTSGRLVVLSDQTDETGSLLTFMPLFACTRTRQFFHPLCPQCGGELDLLTDDTVLSGAGLKPYSTSLRRYLACPVCARKPGALFYAASPDNADPVSVRGAVELVAGLAGLDDPAVPCTACPDRMPCHSSGHFSGRIVPIAFYPFYMFMFEAASLNGADFLALLSGASCSELEASLGARRELTRREHVCRVEDSCSEPLIFRNDERRFLEVLYLKLALLGEVTGHVLNNPEGCTYPGFGLSLERLWVQIPGLAGHLPAFWSFRLALVDMDPRLPAVPPVPGACQTEHCLGLLWFHALVSNRDLNGRAIDDGLRGLLREGRQGLKSPVFAPEHIFWEPAPVSPRWLPHWERALHLGASLLLHEGTESFQENCRDLLEELKGDLFSGAPVHLVPGEPARGGPAPDAEAARIGQVIRSIRQRWAAGGSLGERGQPWRAEGQELDATVVLTPKQPVAPSPSQEDHEGTGMVPVQPVQEMTSEAADDDFRTETVIMHREGPPPAPVEREQAPLDQTVIVGRGPESGHRPAQAPGEDELSETVVVGPGAKAVPQPPGQTPPGQTPPGHDDDDLAETVIIRPEKK